MRYDSQNRSTTFDLSAPPDAYKKVLASIARYRAGCRQVFSLLGMAQAAGATIEAHGDGIRVKPDREAARAVLENAMGKTGKALAYECRDLFLREHYPDALSFVWDAARRDVETAWKSGDPEYPKAQRGWLALQGARGFVQFRGRGIAFPQATARPKLDCHSLTLKWDRTIGPVEFALGKLDGGRYYVWKSLRDETPGWKLGTLYLNERDGKLRATITHERPAKAADIDPARVLAVTFSPERELFIRCVGPEGNHDSLSALDAVGFLEKLRLRQEALQARKAACGNPRRPWGQKQGWRANVNVMERATRERVLRQADTNHAWTRRIANNAKRWRCGVVQIELPQDSKLFGHPWAWSEFKNFLKYKIQEIGGTLMLM